MTKLFSPVTIGGLVLDNRIIASAVYEGMAEEDGRVSDRLVKRIRNLARGGAGLVIPGYMYVMKSGKAMPYQTGIDEDDKIPGLKKLVDAVHREGGKVVFQIAHAGRQTTPELCGQRPFGPSSSVRDPVYFIRPRSMGEADIAAVIEGFAAAAARAVAAGADGIQLHAAHGYLINQFLSPFFNRRKDAWGGSDEKRFRFAKNIMSAVLKEMPDGMPLLVKLNADDFTPRPGITVDIACRYAKWFAQSGVDLIEVSCGTAYFSFMNLCRGDVPLYDLVAALPWWKRPVGRLMLGSMKGKFDLEEGYNMIASRRIKESVSGDALISVVGGLRRKSQMEHAIETGACDMVSLGRPLIREPFLPRCLKEERQNEASCISCNRCLAAAVAGREVRCYHKAE